MLAFLKLETEKMMVATLWLCLEPELEQLPGAIRKTYVMK